MGSVDVIRKSSVRDRSFVEDICKDAVVLFRLLGVWRCYERLSLRVIGACWW